MDDLFVVIPLIMLGLLVVLMVLFAIPVWISEREFSKLREPEDDPISDEDLALAAEWLNDMVSGPVYYGDEQHKAEYTAYLLVMREKARREDHDQD